MRNAARYPRPERLRAENGGQRLGDQAQFPRPGDGLGAAGRAELAQDVADVLLHCIQGDHELAGTGLSRPFTAGPGANCPASLIASSAPT